MVKVLLNNLPHTAITLSVSFLIFMIMSSQGGNAKSPSTSVSPSTTTTTRTCGTKKIYLVRHAESEENRKISALSRTYHNLKRFSLPNFSDVSTSVTLLNVPAQVDSDVSEIGANQIAHMKEKLQQENFVESSGIKLVVHSPLLRARQTSEGMLGCMTASLSDDTIEEKIASTVSRVVETDLLLEKKPAEWTPMYYNGFRKRILDFERWLGEQPEEVIGVVGHSQFFKAMLGLEFKFGNCEVWEVDFDHSLPRVYDGQAESNATTKKSTDDDPSPESSPCWSNLKKLYACGVESSQRTV